MERNEFESLLSAIAADDFSPKQLTPEITRAVERKALERYVWSVFNELGSEISVRGNGWLTAEIFLEKVSNFKVQNSANYRALGEKKDAKVVEGLNSAAFVAEIRERLGEITPVDKSVVRAGFLPIINTERERMKTVMKVAVEASRIDGSFGRYDDN